MSRDCSNVKRKGGATAGLRLQNVCLRCCHFLLICTNMAEERATHVSMRNRSLFLIKSHKLKGAENGAIREKK